MHLTPLPFSAGMEQYESQAAELLQAYRSQDRNAIELLHARHPRFLDEKIPWLKRQLAANEIAQAGLDLADMRLALARSYDFQDWAALAHFAESVARKDSPVYRFEAAAEAVVHGDAGTLQALLRDDPALVRARSTRVTHFDPPVHGSTLLHYVAANGVEGYRQRTPANAVEIAKMLLEAGAEVDALAQCYGVPCTTMTLLVSSCHPANAGLQAALAETLLDAGAAIEGVGSRKWGTPLMVALAFGYRNTAEALARRGARVDSLVAAAGLGHVAEMRELLPGATPEERHRALALASQHGQVDAVKLLLDAGEDPSRYNPEGTHGHSTPLHQAIAYGHDAMVELLVERGARLDIRDTVYQGTPLDWALYLKKPKSEQYLRAHGGRTARELSANES